MNVRSLITILLILCLGLYSCSDESKPLVNVPRNIKVLDVSLAKLNSKFLIDQNKLFDSVKYIALETRPESIFSEIRQMEVTSETILVLDWTTNSILAFDKSGKFKFKISSRLIREFSVDNFNREIAFHDLTSNKKYYYDFNGKLLRSVNDTFTYSSHIALDSGSTAYYRYFYPDSNKNKFKDANLYVVNKDGQISKEYLPFKSGSIKYMEVLNAVKQFYRNGRFVYFIQPYDYTVYSLSPEELKPKFTLKVPEDQSLPQNFRDDDKYFDSRLEYLKENEKMVFSLKDFYQVGSFLTFKIIGMKWGATIFYDLKSDRIVLTQNIASGPDNNYMPLGSDVHCADSSSIYRSITATQLFNTKYRIGSLVDDEKLPSSLKQFFAKQSNRSNPVIINIFPKQQIVLDSTDSK